MAEEWVDIPGYEGCYQVSSHGQVRSLPRPYRNSTKILKLRPNKKGYLRVALCKDGKCKDYKVHRLVLTSFVGPCPEGMIGLHWDDDRTNNHLNNLRWGTFSDNQNDAVRNGTHGMYRRRAKCEELTGML